MTRKRKSRGPVFAKRSLGQNFLVDEDYIRKIVAALGGISDKTIVEIGPGRGALTDLIAENCARFIGIEIDTRLAAILKSKYDMFDTVSIIEQDILSADFSEILGNSVSKKDVRLIANLPYNISTPVLEKLAEATGTFDSAVIMLQKEVVARVTAKPGESDRGFLTVCTEAFFRSEYLFDVPPTAFKPAPKVWSSVVRLVPNINKDIEDSKMFRKLVSSGFMQKRKTILNNLKSSVLCTDAKRLLSESGVDPGLRPEALTLADWVVISNLLSRGLED